MVKFTDLVAYAKQSPYKSKSDTVYCYKYNSIYSLKAKLKSIHSPLLSAFDNVVNSQSIFELKYQNIIKSSGNDELISFYNDLLDKYNRKRYGIFIPCKYNTTPIVYDTVDYPTPLITLRPDQKKVLEEFEDVCIQQVKLAIDKPNMKEVGDNDVHKYSTSKDIPFTLDPNVPNTCICHPIFGNLYTGFGKTWSSIIFAASKKLPIAIICNSDTVRKAWVKSFKEILDIDITVVSGPIIGKHNVCIISSQMMYYHNYSRDEFIHYGTVIVDEADVFCTQNAVNMLLDLTPKYLIGLTATIRRADGLDKVLDIFWGHRKFWIKRFMEFNASHSMNLNICHTGFKVDSILTMKGNLDWNAISETVYNIYERNILIRNLCLLHNNAKILIICKRKEHVKILVTMLKEVGEDVCSYYNTDKSYYDAHILITTLSKAGRGYDDKNVSDAFDGRRFDVLIMTMTVKDADQAMGRALRGNKLNLYLLVDDNSTMKKHAEEMKSINSKRGALIQEEYL